MSFEISKTKTKTEKIQLCTIESVKLAKIFSIESGSIYSRSEAFSFNNLSIPFFVVGVKEDGVSLSEASNSSLSAGEFFYDIESSKIYIRTSDDSDPKEKEILITYRHFFSNKPQALPFDLQSGKEIYWDGRINSIGSISHQLSDEIIGTAIEGTTTVNLENQDGFFDELYDTHIFENQSIKIYQWFGNDDIEENKKIFQGVILDKSFSEKQVKIKAADDFYTLRSKMKYNLFTESDGSILDSILNTPKRRIYGKANKVKCVNLDATKDGFNLTGTFSCSLASTTMTGNGTLFLDELSPEDEVFIEINNELVKFEVESIQSNTSLTLSESSDNSFIGLSAVCQPNIPWRKKSREWHIADHKLREFSASIQSVVFGNKFEVDDASEFFVNDLVEINNSFARVRRVTGNTVVLDQVISPIPSVSDTITRRAVFDAYFKNKNLVIDRDFTVSNTTFAKIVLENDAEFNISPSRQLNVSLLFTNSSRSVTTSADIDLTAKLKSRDWIRKDKVTETEWYEILEVKEKEIILRNEFSGSTETFAARYKNVEYVDDDSLITVSCFGMDHDGAWVKTPSDSIRDILRRDTSLSNINEVSFTKSNALCDYTMSLVLPLSVGGQISSVRDSIEIINKSCFGVLHLDNDYNISLSIFNSNKPEDATILKDDDIISFSVNSKNMIISDIKCYYSPFVDTVSGEDSFRLIEHSSDFVSRTSMIENEEVITIYLFEESDARIVAQRTVFFKSLSSTSVSIKTKGIVADKNLGDKLIIDIDRIYKRYGSNTGLKYLVLNKIDKDGYSFNVSGTDIANIFNRVPAISSNDASVYSSASDQEKLINGYIVDNSTLTPDNTSEDLLGCNLIG